MGSNPEGCLVENLLGWIALGAVAGFIYAWRRTSSSSARAQADLDVVPDKTAGKGYVIGRIQGLRLGVITIFALIGAVAGALIWSAASLLVWLLE